MPSHGRARSTSPRGVEGGRGLPEGVTTEHRVGRDAGGIVRWIEEGGELGEEQVVRIAATRQVLVEAKGVRGWWWVEEGLL